MSVQIIVDSTVDMPERMKDRFRIVPLTVHFGAEEFIDGVTYDGSKPNAYLASFKIGNAK